jgi:hypothetical protein
MFTLKDTDSHDTFADASTSESFRSQCEELESASQTSIVSMSEGEDWDVSNDLERARGIPDFSRSLGVGASALLGLETKEGVPERLDGNAGVFP